MSNVNVVKGARLILSVLCATTVILLLRVNPPGFADVGRQRDEPVIVDGLSGAGASSAAADRLETAEVTPSSSISIGTPIGGVAVPKKKTQTNVNQVVVNVSFSSTPDAVSVTSDADKATTKTDESTKSAASPETKPTTDDKKPAKEPLNILVMYPDDWRHDSLGCAGTPVFTPFLDSLAQQGVRFTHNCVTTSICWVSRA
jgi:hypothetical protein